MCKNATEKTVVELFAGVGGFRLGLEKSGWKTIFANQWEPEAKTQWAFDCYNRHFPDSVNLNVDVATVKASSVPDHELLVGGFPCQDYSVAATLATSKGIQGKKGVLWWEIRRIVEEKKPRFILLENVDRLIKSPAKQRGRDFGIILSCLNTLGYSVEWRVINAADYGFVQRRRRTFIFATKDQRIQNLLYSSSDCNTVLTTAGFFQEPFPCVTNGKSKNVAIPQDLVKLTDSFAAPFGNSGFCINFKAYTADTKPVFNGPFKVLGEVLQQDTPEKYYIKETDLPKWQYMKGAKKEKRTTKDGYEYYFSEGPIAYPDYLDKPARTMLTSEGSKNRSSHVVEDPQTHKLRILTPIECERIDGFDDNWTEGMTDHMRYFCMGNALVVGLIEKMGRRLSSIRIEEEGR